MTNTDLIWGYDSVSDYLPSISKNPALILVTEGEKEKGFEDLRI